MKLALSIALALGVSASAFADTAKPAEKAPETKEVKAEDVQRWLAFFDQVVTTVVADNGKCDQMATDLNALFDKNADVIQVANDAKSKGLKLPKDAQDHMLAGIKKMGPSMQACMKNEKVKAAFGKFDAKGKKH